mmetsp:Transcript_75519/g.204158  ORF Transcript_75519/g.204158 Transcript_75519/m.204158 type:complete len:90 (+) Transcript_75519:194-463(+)
MCRRAVHKSMNTDTPLEKSEFATTERVVTASTTTITSVELRRIASGLVWEWKFGTIVTVEPQDCVSPNSGRLELLHEFSNANVEVLDYG